MEIVIVDDCSDDASFLVAQTLAAENPGKVRALRNTQRSGIAFTLNHGVFHARGALLCFLDPDGEYLPGFVDFCATLLGDHAEFAAVQTLIEVVNADGSRPFGADDPRLLAALDTYTSSMMVRKDVLLALGGFPADGCFNEIWGRAEDAFFNALTGMFRCMRVPHVMVRHNNRSDAHLEGLLRRPAAVVTQGDTQDMLRAKANITAAAQQYYGRARKALSALDQCRLPAAENAQQAVQEGPIVSFVITCKGRLHHLQQTLPKLAVLENVEVIVVDYACPQGTADWVSQHYPQVRVGRVNDDPGFSVARARNIGAYAATAPWLCFVDADVGVERGLLDWARDNLHPGAFYSPQPRLPNALGSCFCTRSAFLEIGGYDEAIRGWGGEDVDFYRRLALAGYREEGYPAALVSPIAHEDEERTRFYEVKDKARSMHMIEWYLLVKYDLMAIRNGPLPLEERIALMTLAKEASMRADDGPGQVSTLSVNLGERMDVTRNVDWQVQRELVYSRSPR